MLTWVETALELIILVMLCIAWVATIIPIFPSPAIMWALTLVYGIVANFDRRGTIYFVLITLLTIAAMSVDNVLSIAGARKGGARWMSVTIASVVGLVGSLFFTPIVGIGLTIAALYLAENYYQQDAEKAWQSTKQMLIGWGWATAARLGIGFVEILLWAAWAFL